MPGGTALYFSHAIAHMPARYLLLTALAASEQKVVDELCAKGVSVRRLSSEHTVVFENKYGENPDQRTQRVLQKAAPFTVGSFEGLQAEIFHLGPLLADDFSVAGIREIAGKGKISLDVQGFLRRVENTAVVPVDWPDKKAVLPLVHFLKASEEEMEVLTGITDIEQGTKLLANWGAAEVIITRGSKGSVVYAAGQFYRIPAFLPSRVQDATGCGDTFMAGYLFQRSSGVAIQQAGEFAAAMATLKIEVSGPFTGTKMEVDEVVKRNRRVVA